MQADDISLRDSIRFYTVCAVLLAITGWIIYSHNHPPVMGPWSCSEAKLTHSGETRTVMVCSRKEIQ